MLPARGSSTLLRDPDPAYNESSSCDGLALYDAALRVNRHSRHDRSPWCLPASPAATSTALPSCHTVLFHGKLDHQCLAARNVTEAQLPCVRSLSIASYPGSGTTAMAVALRRLGLTVAHESHHLETDVIVSWLSRSDAWRVGRGHGAVPDFTTAGPAHDPTYRRRTYRIPWAWGERRVDTMRLSRCLYRRLLLQAREPLAALRSSLSMTKLVPEYSILFDQLLARSGSALLRRCPLPVRPMGVRYNLTDEASRRPLVRYEVRRWTLWMESALGVADASYRIEGTGANATAVCLLGGLPAARCTGAAEAARSSTSGAASRRVTGLHQATTSRNRHSGHQTVPPLSWAEVCAADAAAARHVHSLAERLGYSYDRSAVPCAPRTNVTPRRFGLDESQITV